MPGVDPGIHGRLNPSMAGWVYSMASKPRGTIYVGVTSNLARRAYEHREGLVEGFTRKHGLKLLVWFEEHATVPLAIQREKNIKHWSRAWKLELIEKLNPDWRDLFDEIAG